MKLGLAFSGGGFRATLFHLGVVALLRDQRRLTDVAHICSVSGGSILAAHLVLNWNQYTGSNADFEKAASQLIAFTKTGARGRLISKWLVGLATLAPRCLPGIHAWSRVNLWQKELKVLFEERKMSELRETPKLDILATSMVTGQKCFFRRGEFKRDGPEMACRIRKNIWAWLYPIGEEVTKWMNKISLWKKYNVVPSLRDGVSVVFAVAASSAFPHSFQHCVFGVRIWASVTMTC